LLAGLYSLPTSRARNLYAASWFAIVGGILTIHTDYSPGYASRGWWNNYTPTVWSYLLWGIGIWCIVAMWTDVAQFRRAQRAAAQAPVAARPVVAVQPIAATPVPTPAPAPHVSKLIIPSFPGQGRQVLRRSETLSGIPIKDRRSVDPRTL